MHEPNCLHRTIAAVRIATAVFFYFSASIRWPDRDSPTAAFKIIWQYIGSAAVSFYRPFLSHIVLPHAVFFGYAVGVIELLVGISLLLGLWVRPACILGIGFLLNLTLAAWWDAGHGVPIWRYFGARLDTLPLLFLLVIFFAADAGQTWGLDGMRLRRA